ncbi:alpha/beta fold hydrolase [Streptomyces bottropensis]|uniref:alpha/beta fold hydrolase n=1 Tax=Streptomyces bottropensis TaxID=42235 RepID=UPI003679CD2F
MFVHGIGSSAESWDAVRASLAQTEDLADLEPDPPFQYKTGLFGRKPWNIKQSLLQVLPSIDTVADSLAEYLDTEAADFQRLVLVGHSMGGLVIQRYLTHMLAQQHGQDLRRIRRIVLLACPNTGSDLVQALRKLVPLQNPQELELRPFNELVANTKNLVLANIINARAITPGSCPIPFSVYAGESDGVVTVASAKDAFPDARALPGDHSAILQEQRTFNTLHRLLRDAADSSPLVTVRDADPLGLGVHRAAQSADPRGSTAVDPEREELTPYLVREHDHQLREHLTTAVRAGTSLFALLLGGSTTGKTRALYEAVLGLAPGHVLLHPADAEELQQLLDDGTIVQGTVLWLNETQRYLLGAAGAAIAKRLARQLTESPGIVIVGAMWRTPYFKDLTAKSLSPDGGPIQDLLHHRHTVRLEVRDQLTPAESSALRTLAVEHSDKRVIEALDAGKTDGRVIQHLSGGPELLAAYLQSGGPELVTAYRERSPLASVDHAQSIFTPVEHAIITAALDARRLGHHQPIPAALLADAADGYLSPGQRLSEPDWAETALRDLTHGYRRDDREDRTDVRRCLTALTTHSTQSGTQPSYEPADYLEQHTGVVRYDQLGPPSLWNALTVHTSEPADLERLAEAARKRGLLKTAVGLFRKAVLAGNPDAADNLIKLLRGGPLDPDLQASIWVVDKIDMTHSSGVAELLSSVNYYGPEEAKRALLNRKPAEHAALADTYGVATLIDALIRAGASEALQALLDRQPAEYVDLDDPVGVVPLLYALNKAEAKDAVQRLSTRAVSRVDVSSKYPSLLLDALSRVGAKEAEQRLVTRASMQLDVSDLSEVRDLLSHMRGTEMLAALETFVARVAESADLNTGPFGELLNLLSQSGAKAAVETLAARASTHVEQTSLASIAALLSTLMQTGEQEEARRLAILAAEQADPSDPEDVARLLDELMKVGAKESWAIEASETLAARAAAHADLSTGLSSLVICLNNAGRRETVEALIARASAHVERTTSSGIAHLLRALREKWAEEAWAEEAVPTLAARAAAHTDLQDLHGVVDLLSELTKAGEQNAVQVLATRAAEHAPLTDAYYVGTLLSRLTKAGQSDAVQKLLGRRLVEQVELSSPDAIGRLLSSLDEAGDRQAKQTLSARAAAHVKTYDPYGVYELCWKLSAADSNLLYRRTEDTGSFGDMSTSPFEANWSHGGWGHGREADGQKSPPWTWNELNFST